MIITKIEPYLDGNVLKVLLTLEPANVKKDTTTLAIQYEIKYKELEKINVGDDIQTTKNKTVRILKKNNKTKYILQKVCPICGRPLEPIYKDKTKKEIEKYICTNLYGCSGQKVDLLIKWCAWYGIKSLALYVDEFLKYFSLDNFILDRTIKKAIERTIPILYFINQNMLIEWVKDKEKATKILNEINKSKKKIILQDIFFIFPNNFSKKEIDCLIAKYKTIKGLLNIQERELPKLEKVFSKESILNLFEFLRTHKETFELLEKSGVSLENKALDK